MIRFYERHPLWSLVILLAVAFVAWLVLAPWPPGFVDVFGRKKIFLNALFNGITLGGLYFLVASGFTLIFGLMRNVNLAHGSLYLLGGYIGYEIADWTGSWVLSFIVAFIVVAAVGVVLQVVVFRRMEGRGPAPDPGDHRYLDRHCRSDAVDLGRRLLSDPDAGLVIRTRQAAADHRDEEQRRCGLSEVSRGAAGHPDRAPSSIGIGMWLALNRTRDRHADPRRRRRPGHAVRHRRAHSAWCSSPCSPSVPDLPVLPAWSAAPSSRLRRAKTSRFLLASLVVVIVGGMGSIPGAALGALI